MKKEAAAAPAMMNRYPPGYRFVPTDAELIVEYLKKKIDNEPLPIVEINDTELIKQNPWGLTEKYPKLGDKEWYFFTPRKRKYPNGRRPNRGSKDGYWKPTGADIAVTVGDETVGYKKALVFYKGKPQKGVKTNWIMHEFRVKDSEHQKTTPEDMMLDVWVLCRIKENTKENTGTKLTTTTTTNKRKKKTNTSQSQSQSRSRKGKEKVEDQSLSAVSISVDDSTGESCETAIAAPVVNNLPIINPYSYNNHNNYMINTTGDYSSLQEDLMEQYDPINSYLNEEAFTNLYQNEEPQPQPLGFQQQPYLNQQPYASSSSSSLMAMAPYLNEPQPLGFQSSSASYSLPPNNNTNFAPFYGHMSQSDAHQDNKRFRFY